MLSYCIVHDDQNEKNYMLFALFGKDFLAFAFPHNIANITEDIALMYVIAVSTSQEF